MLEIDAVILHFYKLSHIIRTSARLGFSFFKLISHFGFSITWLFFFEKEKKSQHTN